MTNESFAMIIDGIDTALIEEAACPIINKKINFVKLGSIAAALAVCVSIGAFAVGITSVNHNSGLINDTSYGGSDIATPNENSSVKIIGEAFSTEEINKVINENADIIALNLSAEYNCFGQEIQIFNKGYYHVVLGDENIVNLNYITLPVCIDGRIIANIEISRSDNEMHYTLNAGGEKWAVMNEALDYSDNIIFAFVGGLAAEVAFAPDNTAFSIISGATDLIDANTDWYSLLATEYNTFSKKELNNSDNYITVTSE